jgi:carbonic anhydrase/acetyltransferase-like protein (isoleucine patch superfamily)
VKERRGMAIEKNMQGDLPQIARTAFVHPTAALIGHVIVGKHVFIAPYAVLRADEPTPEDKVAPIIIHDRVNIQDGVVIHALAGSEVRVGPKTSLAHGALVHGPAILGRNCFVGFKSIVFKATLGNGSILMHNVLIENSIVPDNYSIPSGEVVRCENDLFHLVKVDAKLRAFANTIALTNITLARNYSNAARDRRLGPGRMPLVKKNTSGRIVPGYWENRERQLGWRGGK